MLTRHREKLSSLIAWALLAFILFVYLFRLEAFPPGLHGDEAWTGIRALEISQHGPIGFFDSVHSLGQWALPEYLTVPFMLLVDEPMIAVRLPMALIGFASIVIFYLFVKDTLGPNAGLGAICLLAFFPAHFLLSRVGFPAITTVFFGATSLYFLARWHKENNYYYLFLCGIALGLGSIAYGAFPAFAASFLLGMIFLRDKLKQKVINLSIVIAGIILILAPALFYERNNTALANRGTSALSLSISQVAADSDLRSRFARDLESLFVTHHVDGSDGTGSSTFFNLPGVLLFFAGLFITLRERQRFPLGIPLLVTFALSSILGFYSSVLIGFGLYRRLLVTLLPFLWLSLVPLASSNLTKPILRWLFSGLAAGAVALTLIQNLKMINSAEVAWPYCADLTNAIYWARSLPDTTNRVGLAATRWDINYETSRYLAAGKWELLDIDTPEKIKLAAEGHHTVLLFISADDYKNEWSQLKCTDSKLTREFFGCYIE